MATAALVGGVRGEEPPRFEPGEISIGEPFQLPKRAASQPATAAGSGWLGLTADDSLVPGRLVVVDVAQPGPAAQAGIRPQDQVLAINGTPLRNSDQLAAELAAIAPGGEVKMAIGRGDRIDEVVMKAAERPARTATAPAGAMPTAPLSASSPAAEPSPSRFVSPSELPTPQPAAVQPLEPQVIAGDFGPANLPAQPLNPKLPASMPNEPPAAVYVPPAAAAPSYVPPAAAAPSFVPPAAVAPALVAPAAAAPAFEPATLAPAEPLRTAAPTPAPQSAAKGRTALGVRTLPVDPSVQARFGLPEPAGALVIGVVHDLPASRAGVPPGSVIVALGDKPVRSPNELTQVVTSSPADRPMTLQYILPGGERRRAEVSLQSLEVPLEQALVGPPR